MPTPIHAWLAGLADPRPGERVADLGCGHAPTMLQLALRCPDAAFMGLDLRQQPLLGARNDLRQAGVDAALVRADLSAPLPLAASSVDAAVCEDLIECLPDVGQADTLAGHAGLSGVAEGPAAELWMFSTGLPRERLGDVRQLFVSPRLRRQGIGEQLLAVASAEARSRCLKPVLEVIDRNRDAMAVYRRLGWKVAGSLEVELGAARNAWSATRLLDPQPRRARHPPTR